MSCRRRRERPATPTEPQQWQLHPPSEDVAISHWPKIPNFVFADAGTLPAPALSDLDWRDGASMTACRPSIAPTRPARGVPLPREAPWPRLSLVAVGRAPPSPCRCRRRTFSRYRKGCASRSRSGAPLPHHAEQTVADHEANSTDAGDSRHSDARQASCGKRAARRRSRQARHAAHARHGGLKHLVQVRKRSV